jgi:hypothetical protein
MELRIPTPKNFNFRRTVISHGWYDLRPFSLNTRNWELTRVIDFSKSPATISLVARKNHVRVTTTRPLNKTEAAIAV